MSVTVPAADVLQQIEGVDADIADGSAEAGLRRVRPPHGLLMTGGLE